MLSRVGPIINFICGCGIFTIRLGNPFPPSSSSSSNHCRHSNQCVCVCAFANWTQTIPHRNRFFLAFANEKNQAGEKENRSNLNNNARITYKTPWMWCHIMRINEIWPDTQIYYISSITISLVKIPTNKEWRQKSTKRKKNGIQQHREEHPFSAQFKKQNEWGEKI